MSQPPIPQPHSDIPGDSRRERVPDAVVDAIVETLQGVQYGQITVSVQDGRVVQIERLERQRLKS